MDAKGDDLMAELHRAPGKWILAGEHAVLRGCPALVFPLEDRTLSLAYTKSGDPLSIEFSGAYGGELKIIFWGLLESAVERLGHRIGEVTGRMSIVNEIPLGAGLGASAALCVVVARWCEARGWIKCEDLYEFARGLEDHFHGESSGVDIAVALTGEPLKFQRGGIRETLKVKWQPQWELTFSGHRGVTSECVAKVKSLAESSPEKFAELDEKMRRAVKIAEEALVQENPYLGLNQLVEAVEMAGSCFEEWGLTQGEIGQTIKEQRSKGALAVKPTGSGGGGYVLSLWS